MTDWQRHGNWQAVSQVVIRRDCGGDNRNQDNDGPASANYF